MRVDGLPLSQQNPRPQRDDVALHDRGPGERGYPENEYLRPVRVRGRHAHARGELVVLVVDVGVQPPVVHPTVQPVVAVIFHEEENEELEGHLGEGGQRETARDAGYLRNRDRDRDLFPDFTVAERRKGG